MASITQTIPNYNGGISEAPDQFKLPGQAKNIVNAIPDLTYGLYKRPGTERVGSSRLANVAALGSWFHYYRDETEGSYIGQVQSNGTVKMWSCTDGAEKTVHYGAIPWVAGTAYVVGDKVQNGANIYVCDTAGTSAGSGGPTGTGANITDNTTRWDYEATVSATTTAIKGYLTPSSATATEDIQALTINDTTFINNRTKTVATTGTTASAPHAHYAYVELLRTENGRQYALNVFDSNTTTDIKRATRVKIDDDNLAEGSGTGHCPGIGTQVFSVTAAGSYSGTTATTNWVKNSSGTTLTSGRDNLIFRITTLGQQGSNPGASNINSAADYACTYNREVILLHGGEGWEVGDQVNVTLDQASTSYTYTIEVQEIETAAVKGTIGGSVSGILRPTPTPFDSDTAVTVDTILGSLQVELNAISGITATIIGNGIYVYSSSAFNVEVVDQDLLRVMQDTVNDVTKLPLQCKFGYIVKIQNTKSADEDDYYVKFSSANDLDGVGSWVECAKPGIALSFDKTTMPHMLQRAATGDFLVKQTTYTDRLVGDEYTNPVPTFVGQKINKIVFFRNRLCFLSGENVITSRPGELLIPAFWSWTALATSAIDPIDIACSSTFPSELYDAVEMNVGLVVFSTNQQFILVSDAEVLNPDTAKLKKLSIYNYNEKIPPVNIGTTIGFVDSSGKYSRFTELVNVQREGDPDLAETSKVVPTLLPKDIDMITHSRENGMVLFGKTGQDEVQGWRYYQLGDQRLISSWFKWKFNIPLRYHFIVNDTYYYLDSDNFLQTMEIIQTDTSPSIDQDSVNYRIHLDNWTTISGGVYNSTTNLTTFTNQSDWIDQIGEGGGTPNGKLVIVDTDTATKRLGRYAEPTVINDDDFTIPGDWDLEKEWEVPAQILVDENTVPGFGLTTNTITLTTSPSTPHNIKTGDPIKYIAGSSPVQLNTGNLVDGGTYYAIDDGLNQVGAAIQLANSKADALAGTDLNIIDEGAGTHKFQHLVGDLHIGYLYDYQIDFPRLYVTKQVDKTKVLSDVNSSLTVHRIKLNFGKVGLYETTLTRVGKSNYTEVYESTILDEYEASDAPYLDEHIQAVPVYENNKNVDITLKSSHPSPATLRSMSWEGDFSPKYYKRV